MSAQQPEPSAPDEQDAPHEQEEGGGPPTDAEVEEHAAGTTEDEEERESDAVEGHEPEEGDGQPPEPQALSQKQLEQAFGKLERETERHAKRVQEIMGDDAAMLLACPMCDDLLPGFVMPSPATPERFPAVREFMGDAQPADYQQDPNTRTCQTCAGEGVVETGSRVDSQRLLACTDCGGKGWQGSRAPVALTGPAAPAPPVGANGHDEQAAPSVDPPEIADLKRRGYVIIEPPKATV